MVQAQMLFYAGKAEKQKKENLQLTLFKAIFSFFIS